MAHENWLRTRAMLNATTAFNATPPAGAHAIQMTSDGHELTSAASPKRKKKRTKAEKLPGAAGILAARRAERSASANAGLNQLAGGGGCGGMGVRRGVVHKPKMLSEAKRSQGAAGHDWPVTV